MRSGWELARAICGDLFLKHLGATPRAVAQTRRLNFAKKLIDETQLPMSQVAIASGFGSVRRFNGAIEKIYHRSPTQLRKLARRANVEPENQYLFRLDFRPPYSWKTMLAFLSPRATPGVEIIDGNTYRRSISTNGCCGHLAVSLSDKEDELQARVQFSDPRLLFHIVERIRAIFDLNADWATIAQHLRADPGLAERMEADPGVRVAGCWNAFELTVRAILGQQVSVKCATALAGRMVASFGQRVSAPEGITHIFPTPEVLADAKLESAGVTGARAETIRSLARAVCDGRISFDRVVDTNILLTRLCEIRGIGKWTAQYVAMRALGEPDAFPSGDLGLLRALNLQSSRELEERAEAWRPWRAYAVTYLWSNHSKNKNCGTI